MWVDNVSFNSLFVPVKIFAWKKLDWYPNVESSTDRFMLMFDTSHKIRKDD
jgi:hypothetical protein